MLDVKLAILIIAVNEASVLFTFVTCISPERDMHIRIDLFQMLNELDNIDALEVAHH
jgi:hypothetical protein